MEEEINVIELHKRRSLKIRNATLTLRIILITKNIENIKDTLEKEKPTLGKYLQDLQFKIHLQSLTFLNCNCIN
jgi:hypothetical protein